MRSLFGARRYVLVCLLASLVGGALAARIALGTPYNIHPDEFIHVDAFCYFEARAWLPPLNLNGLEYGPEGESRVYDNEIVYWVYGRLGAGLAWMRAWPAGRVSDQAPAPPLAPANAPSIDLSGCRPHYLVFRLFNLALLLITLGLLFWVGLEQAWAAGIGMLLLCLPQVLYTYAYANSDAWALSFAIFLIVFALAERQPLGSLPKALLLGLLVGIVLLSKESVWPAIPFAGLLIGYRVARDWRSARPAPLAAGLAMLLLVIAPMRIWYPLSQGGHVAEQLAQIREERASPGFKPSDPYAYGRQLRSKGVGLGQIVFDPYWETTTLQSFYGDFGYLSAPAPNSADWTALALGILNVVLTLRVIRRQWALLPGELRLAWAASPALVAVCVAASLYNSWTHDYQPQGRYVLVAAVPVALWMWGALPWEGQRLRALRLASAAVLLLACAYALWRSLFMNAAFGL